MKKVNLLDNILDHTHDGVLVLDLNGTILSANEPARKLLDFHESDLVNHSYADVFNEKTRHGAFVHILDEALHKNLECHLKEINYYNSADELIAHIKQRVSSWNVDGYIPHFTAGDRVVVNGGPFCGVEGIFHRYSSARKRCQVLLHVLSQQTKVELPVETLRVEQCHKRLSLAA